MAPAHVVGTWAALNVVLALLLLPFHPDPLPLFLYLAASALVAAYGLAVVRNIRTGRVGAQHRQPRRATSAVCAALGVAIGLTAFAYGWWLAPLAFYPLLLAVSFAPGERVPARARPQPGTLGDPSPRRPATAVHDGSPEGKPRAQRAPLSPLRLIMMAGLGARAVRELLGRRRDR